MNNHESTQPELTDDALVARITQRDKVAFGMIYDRYSRSVYALAAHTLGVSEAEEVVQEVFLRLWNKSYQFDRTRSAFNTWLMAIAWNYVTDRLRYSSKEKNLIATEEVDQLLLTAIDPTMDVEQQSSMNERGAILLRALQTLPPEQRRVLILAYFSGLSQAAIAEQLKWPLGTVKKRIALGLKKLRSALAEEGLEFDTLLIL